MRIGFLSSSPKSYVRKPHAGWDRRSWASRIPFRRPENFVEVFRAAWENRDNLRYARRILAHGVCDGCALGTAGMKDWTIDGVHLCNVRLRLLRLNTLPAMPDSALANVGALRNLDGGQLRALGRLAHPMIRRPGEPGFSRISWDEALETIAGRIRATTPDRTYYYLTSRGIPNETYYAAQKAVRAMGSNNIDNAARICHSPSTFALKSALGVAATTCSYSDLIGTDVVTFFGSNVASNQPVVMKYLFHAKKAGTKVVSVNPFREPGMDAYWIPSDLESAAFGTKITDQFIQLRAGSDLALLSAIAKRMVERDVVDESFVRDHTVGFDAFRAGLQELDWSALEQESGVSLADVDAYVDLLARAENAVFVWGMGITQHSCGEENVQAIINIALLKGFVGRRGCGLMPIRGHSGVQGGAEMGAYATVFPGGVTIAADPAANLSLEYAFPISDKPGLTTPEALDRAADGGLDVLVAVGGNFRDVMPGADGAGAALANVPFRVHIDIVASGQMLLDADEAVVLLPATTRYEIPGGVTETSTERRVIFSPEIPGPRIPEARPEWQTFGDLAARVRPEFAQAVQFTSTAAIRDEIARVIPYYDGIQHLSQEGDQFQYGGPMLCDDWQFPTPDGKAHFVATASHGTPIPEGEFVLVTRRGKQFNSMVHEKKETATGFTRDAVLMNALDARSLGLRAGGPVRLASDHGSYEGTLRIADVARGTIEVYWPEGNVLLDTSARSPLARIPAYKSGRVRVLTGGSA